MIPPNGRKRRGTKGPLEEEESERATLKLNMKKKTKIMASSPITAWQIEGGKVEVVSDFLFLHSKITALQNVDGDCSHETEDICSLTGKL